MTLLGSKKLRTMPMTPLLGSAHPLNPSPFAQQLLYLDLLLLLLLLLLGNAACSTTSKCIGFVHLCSKAVPICSNHEKMPSMGIPTSMGPSMGAKREWSSFEHVRQHRTQ